MSIVEAIAEMIVSIIMCIYNIITFLVNKNKKSDEVIKKYYKYNFILTEYEKIFYYTLEKICIKNNFKLFVKVRMSDLIEGETITEMNKIQRKHIDFIICNNKLEILLAIELNDSSHSEYNRRKRDFEVNEIFNEAELPLLWIEGKKKYNENEIEKKIYDKILQLK